MPTSPLQSPAAATDLISILKALPDALSLACLRQQVDPQFTRGISFQHIELTAMQLASADVTTTFMDWLPIPSRSWTPASQRKGQAKARPGLVLNDWDASAVEIGRSNAKASSRVRLTTETHRPTSDRIRLGLREDNIRTGVN